MIKILFFIPGLSEGGAEKVLCNLVNNMDQSKYEITVQTVFKFDSEKYLKQGIRYKSIFQSGKKNKLMTMWYRFCTSLRMVYPLFIKDDYDIEVAYLECGATKVISTSTNKKAKKIAWVHCDLKKKGITGKRVGHYYSKFDYAVCVSKDVKESFEQLFGEKVPSIVLRNIIDEEEILEKGEEEIEWNVEGNTKRFLAVGRLTEQKNFKKLIDICRLLRDNGYSFSLNILGEGPLYAELKKQIEENRLEKMITLRGFVSNPYPWIKKTDYVICSSVYEGMSTVLQEALILGKIVVTTPCTGMKELLGESEYGIVVDDESEGLYDGIRRLMENPKLEMHYLKKSKEKAMMLKKKSVLNEIYSFFENL